jgi:ABC-type sulfate transport system permease component
MGNRSILTATGAVKIDHRLSQTAVTIKRAQETIAKYKRALSDEQAARLDSIELSLSAALVSANQSMQFFRSARVSLRPMDFAEERLIEAFLDRGVTPEIEGCAHTSQQ